MYAEDRKGMYRMPQTGIIAHDQFVEVPEPFGYVPVSVTSELCQNKVRPISFKLVVDGFGVIYTSKNTFKHVLNALHTKYKVKTDWEENYMPESP